MEHTATLRGSVKGLASIQRGSNQRAARSPRHCTGGWSAARGVSRHVADM